LPRYLLERFGASWASPAQAGGLEREMRTAQSYAQGLADSMPQRMLARIARCASATSGHGRQFNAHKRPWQERGRQTHRSFFMLLTRSSVDWLCVLLRSSIAWLSDSVRAIARARLTVPPRRLPPAAREQHREVYQKVSGESRPWQEQPNVVREGAYPHRHVRHSPDPLPQRLLFHAWARPWASR
jgi:hypothetical protein